MSPRYRGFFNISADKKSMIFIAIGALRVIMQQFYKMKYRKMIILWSFSYNSFIKFPWEKKFGNHNMAVLYPNLCYNEVCYKGTALYLVWD